MGLCVPLQEGQRLAKSAQKWRFILKKYLAEGPSMNALGM